ncbi:metal-dependent hydrolase [Candidatus Zixiibacteriota bacterium]
MPLPVGHSLAGYLIYLGAERDVSLRRWKIILLYVIAANLPDLDILPGFLVGLPNLYHHGISHSLGLAILMGLVVLLYRAWQRKRDLLRVFGIAFGLYLSHVLLDCLITDTTAPFGVQLLWPLSNRYVISPLLIFPTVYKAGTSGIFLSSLVHPGNLKLIGVELLYFVPLVAAAQLWLRRNRGRR